MQRMSRQQIAGTMWQSLRFGIASGYYYNMPCGRSVPGCWGCRGPFTNKHNNCSLGSSKNGMRDAAVVSVACYT